MPSVTVFLTLPTLLAQTPTGLPPPSATRIDYTRNVQPILEAKCFSCHGPTQAQSGLRLDLRQNALRGGDYGVVIVPGKSAESKLILRLAGSTAGLQMPPTGPLDPGEIGLLRAWIDQGADMPGRVLDLEPKKKPTDPRIAAFQKAIREQDLAIVRAQLDTDPSLARCADASGSTALMHAAYAGTLDTMRLLLDRGADLEARNKRKATALHWAAAAEAKVRLLLGRGAPIDAATVDGRTVLHLAALQPAGAPIVEFLLERGANPNTRTIIGQTPLMVASATSLASVRVLLAKGADPHMKTDTGSTALMAAAGSRNPAIVALLVARGVEVKARTKRGETALAAAANRGDIESVRLLLAKGADANARDYRGYAPLMQAAYCDTASGELIRLLLAHGADPGVTGENETPLSLAQKRGETEVTRILREASSTRKPLAANR